MSVKIKVPKERAEVKRQCFICGKVKLMTKWQRFCSSACKNQAAETDRFGSEYHYHTGRN